MLGRTPQKRHTPNDGSRDENSPDCLAKFLIEQQRFRLIAVEDKCEIGEFSKNSNEIVRFTVHGRTLAIVEDRRPELDGETRNMIARLTGRELQIAAMIAEGAANKNVAHKLRISEWTVGTHLRRIFAKLGVDNRAAMVYRCAPLLENAPKPEAKAPRQSVSGD